ncbi:hypothetical protein TwortDSMZ_103 [Staphylococcus phage Twort]|uniref:Uncharacterized protein n=2 Tax=Staphylococcus phage Twort (strain DSM 17442 / HER 48) TaxID=2908167 RepID=A0A6H0X5H6_BPTWO|nr:ORF185 [Staphylococcus phage Twort]AAX92452.1 ORF185 [Staphylococcus phage Twort]QIW89102.1 hypothetical protein TwortDSMZ_103 [Staphylococcus phage Twort]
MASKRTTPKYKHNGYVHIDTFLDTAKTVFHLSEGQCEGFKALMSGKHYQFQETDFLPYLEDYLGKKLEV